MVMKMGFFRKEPTMVENSDFFRCLRLKSHKMKNKHGWIRLVEALVAILLILGVALVALDKEYIKKTDITPKVFLTETAILREIQMNESFRDYILGTAEAVEFGNFPPELSGFITKRIPDYLNCTSKICGIQESCNMDLEEKDIYVQSVMIAANTETYNPRQIKLFCWTAE